VNRVGLEVERERDRAEVIGRLAVVAASGDRNGEQR
jgi:hypothetical protein